MFLGNMLNYAQTQIEVRIMGHVPRKIKPLREEAAVSRGAEFLGESFIFVVAAGAVMIEYLRQHVSKVRSERNEAVLLQAKMEAERERDRILERAILRMDARMARVERALWMADASGIGEEEQLRRDREAAARTADLKQKLEDSRLSAFDSRKDGSSSDGNLEPLPAGAAAGNGRGRSEQVKELLTGPTERERAIGVFGASLDKINRFIAEIEPLWTSGFADATNATARKRTSRKPDPLPEDDERV